MLDCKRPVSLFTVGFFCIVFLKTDKKTQKEQTTKASSTNNQLTAAVQLCLTCVIGVGVHVQVGVLLHFLRTAHNPAHHHGPSALHPHQVREVRVVLAGLCQRRIKRR